MAVENRGVDIKFENDTAVRFTCAIVDQWAEPPDAVTTGTVQVRLLHQTPGIGRWEVYNWVANTFDDPVDATGANYHTTAANIAVGSGTPYATAIWEKRLAVLTAFEAGHQYYVEMAHSTTPVENGQGKFYSYFQYGPPPQEGKWYESGSCNQTLYLRLSDGITACPQVICIVRSNTGVPQASEITDDEGKLLVQLDPGSYLAWFGPDSLYTFGGPKAFTVAANGETHNFTCILALQPNRGWTLGQMKGMLQFAFADFSVASAGARYMSPAIIEDWIRAAHYSLDAALRWTRDSDALESVDGQKAYIYDGDLLQEISEVTYEGELLKRVPVSEYLERWGDETTEGTPEYWSLNGAEIWLYPWPDTDDEDIIVSGVALPPPMGSDSAMPTLPAQYHSLIVDWALAQGYRHLGNMEMEQTCMAGFKALAEMASHERLTDRGDAQYTPPRSVL